MGEAAQGSHPVDAFSGLELDLSRALRVGPRVDEAYFRSEVAPLLDQPGIEFIGEIDERQKSRFLGDARALLFPIDWPEPFGLVMIEAMARGTPVLAFRHGSVSEVVEDGITGYVVESVEEAICKLGRLLALDRGRVRRRFEQRFTADRMAHDYLKVYARLVGAQHRRRRSRVPAGRSMLAESLQNAKEIQEENDRQRDTDQPQDQTASHTDVLSALVA